MEKESVFTSFLRPTKTSHSTVCMAYLAITMVAIN